MCLRSDCTVADYCLKEPFNVLTGTSLLALVQYINIKTIYIERDDIVTILPLPIPIS